MKQKLFFLMLTLIMLSVASVQAQVTIGADATPHSAAVLDLQSNLGLKLPTVALNDVTVFQLLEEGNENIATATGITVYNSNDATTGGSGKGIYVWEGKWVFTARSAPVDVPVTKIDITSAEYATELNASGAGSTLQLTATVAPDNASNKTLRWTQVYNPATTAGKVTVDENGLVTGVKAGTVTVRATATDDSGAYGSLTLNVKPTNQVSSITIAVINNLPTVEAGQPLSLQATVEPTTAYQGVLWSSSNTDIASVGAATGLVSTIAAGNVIITATAQDGSNVNQQIEITVTEMAPIATTTVTIGGEGYQAYVYLNKLWTVENMSHGTAAYTYYPPNTDRVVSYYNNTQFQSVCDNGFRVPTIDDWSDLKGLIESGMLAPNELRPWYGSDTKVGFVNGSTGAEWGNNSYYWMANPLYATNINSSNSMQIRSWANTDNFRFTVRCVRDL
jgi:uncharacterized protein YjdB